MAVVDQINQRKERGTACIGRVTTASTWAMLREMMS
ncbi:DUF4113 domain-containing protein [Pseudomonas sp. GM80]|nr:DUF4113 domain-containing protein [Pseudomonas sp. GM80]